MFLFLNMEASTVHSRHPGFFFFLWDRFLGFGVQKKDRKTKGFAWIKKGKGMDEIKEIGRGHLICKWS